jgi:hypothetical protein
MMKNKRGRVHRIAAKAKALAKKQASKKDALEIEWQLHERYGLFRQAGGFVELLDDEGDQVGEAGKGRATHIFDDEEEGDELGFGYEGIDEYNTPDEVDVGSR